MKKLLKQLVAMGLATVMALGLAIPAMAYSTPDFSDLPADNWAYDSVMRMADAGVIQGTGNGQFSPTMKVSVAQFLTLVGRIVFPETTVGASDTWYGPYVAACQNAGFLSGTQVDTGNVEAEISRYDMAVILRAAAKKLGKAETLAQPSQVTDYTGIPTQYTDAVLAVYGMGLIKGDQAGNFNGSNTMMRNELATVIDRLVALKAPAGFTTEPEKPSELQPETLHRLLSVEAYTPEPYSTNRQGERPLSDVPLQLRYSEDGGKTSRLIAECTSYRSSSGNYVSLTVDIDKALVDNENGQFYFSGETEYNGQRLVTQDLRSDGRATIVPITVIRTPNGQTFSSVRVELVPPTGFKRTVTIDYGYGIGPNRDRNYVAQFRYYPNPENAEYGGGILLGEAHLDNDGNYLITFDLDTVDFKNTKCYRIEIYDTDSGALMSYPDLVGLLDTAPRHTKWD